MSEISTSLRQLAAQAVALGEPVAAVAARLNMTVSAVRYACKLMGVDVTKR